MLFFDILERQKQKNAIKCEENVKGETKNGRCKWPGARMLIRTHARALSLIHTWIQERYNNNNRRRGR